MQAMKESSVNRKFVLVFVLLLSSAIVLTYAASKYPVLPLDIKSYQEMQEEASPFFDMLMKGVSYLGETSMALALTVVAMMTFALRRQWIEAIFMLATISNVLVTFALKELIHRARPFPVPIDSNRFLQVINQYSFPSGHVLFFVVFFGLFAYLAWLNFTGHSRILVVLVCAALIILIGPSRVFLGAHWASDVLGGYIIGTIWLLILIILYQWAIRRSIHEA